MVRTFPHKLGFWCVREHFSLVLQNLSPIFVGQCFLYLTFLHYYCQYFFIPDVNLEYLPLKSFSPVRQNRFTVCLCITYVKKYSGKATEQHHLIVKMRYCPMEVDVGQSPCGSLHAYLGGQLFSVPRRLELNYMYIRNHIFFICTICITN